MARNDFRLYEGRFPTHAYRTKAASIAIKAGEWVIKGTAGDAKYVKIAADGSSTADVHVGIALSNDTSTSSSDGYVDVLDDPDAVYAGKPTTPANLTDAILNTAVTLDVASGVFTVDENDTTNGMFIIIGYNVEKNEVYFKIKKSAHIFA